MNPARYTFDLRQRGAPRAAMWFPRPVPAAFGAPVMFIAVRREPPPLLFAAGPVNFLGGPGVCGPPGEPLAGRLPAAAAIEDLASATPRDAPAPGLEDAEDAEFEELAAPLAPARRHSSRRRTRRSVEGALERRLEDATVPAPPPVRAVFPKAKVRQLEFGEFGAMIGGQLEHPERMAPDATIACALQVFETAAPMPPHLLANAVRTAAGNRGDACRLDEALAGRLGLAPLPPPATAGAMRFAHFLVLADPTAQPPERSEARFTAQPPRPEPKAIPERYLRPWDFRFTREEVLYDMRRAPARSGIVAFALRLLKWRRTAADLRKWQTLLEGKPPEDQLWAVRPPAAAFGDPAVKQWVARTLAACGYPQTMTAEWEIYWRRKSI